LFPPFLPGFVVLAVETRPGISENLFLQFPILRFALEVENSPKIGVPFEEVLILGLVLLPLKTSQEFESGSRFTIVTKSEGKVITSLFLDILVDGFDLLTGLTNFPLSEFEGLMVSVLVAQDCTLVAEKIKIFFDFFATFVLSFVDFFLNRSAHSDDSVSRPRSWIHAYLCRLGLLQIRRRHWGTE
jgi:hypothetical protein